MRSDPQALSHINCLLYIPIILYNGLDNFIVHSLNVQTQFILIYFGTQAELKFITKLDNMFEASSFIFKQS